MSLEPGVVENSRARELHGDYSDPYPAFMATESTENTDIICKSSEGSVDSVAI